MATPEEILRTAAQEYERLTTLASEALTMRSDKSGRNEYVLQLRQLIIDLPDQILSVALNSDNFPSSALHDELIRWANIAEAAKTDLEVLLIFIPPDSRPSEPNQLEQLINTYYPRA
ncbi:MAG TPA: hypothetical protein VLH19_02015 [Patescibacteria group bacterium]|nr:hypothetical protein [Patescibacteria group bacterium]